MIRGTGKPHSYPIHAVPTSRTSLWQPWGGLCPFPTRFEEPRCLAHPRPRSLCFCVRTPGRKRGEGLQASCLPRATNLPGAAAPPPQRGRCGAGGRGARVPSHVAAAPGRQWDRTRPLRQLYMAFLLLMGFVSTGASPSRSAIEVKNKTMKEEHTHKTHSAASRCYPSLRSTLAPAAMPSSMSAAPPIHETAVPVPPPGCTRSIQTHPASHCQAELNSHAVSWAASSPPSHPHFSVEIPGEFKPEKLCIFTPFVDIKYIPVPYFYRGTLSGGGETSVSI